MEEIARPPRYTHWLEEEQLAQVTSWATEFGLNKDVAALIGISHTTFDEWRKRFPAFDAAIKRGRKQRAVDIELKLHDVAMGGLTEEVTEFEEYFDEESGRWVPKLRKRRVRKIPPNPSVLIFEAKNRCGYSDNPNNVQDSNHANEFLEAWRDA